MKEENFRTDLDSLVKSYVQLKFINGINKSNFKFRKQRVLIKKELRALAIKIKQCQS